VPLVLRDALGNRNPRVLMARPVIRNFVGRSQHPPKLSLSYGLDDRAGALLP
jgi:hypothetical protein